jgi:hypothetical protein
VFIDAFISSILQAALVFSWFLLLIIPVRWTKSSSNGHEGSVKACRHHSWLLNLEVPKPRQIPASSLWRCLGYPTMWPKTKP